MKKYLLVFLFYLLTVSCYAQLDANAATAWNDSLVPKMTELALKNFPLNETYYNRKVLADENLFQTKLSWLNSLAFTYQYNPSTTSSSQTGQVTFPKFGVGLTVNIGSIFIVPSRINQAKAELSIAEADYRNHLNYVRAEVVRRYANFIRAVDLLRVRSQAVDDCETSMRMAKHKYENGEISLDEYNKELRSYTDNLERKVVAQGDVKYHKATLEELIGVKLEAVN